MSNDKNSALAARKKPWNKPALIHMQAGRAEGAQTPLSQAVNVKS